MRQGGPNGRRPRGRHHGGGGHNGGGHGGGGHMGGHDRSNGNGGGNPNLGNRPRSAASLRHQTFDSNCIDVRVRGNAWQVHEKYQALARDAQSAGDRVAAENYLQHAEHYFRIIEAINEATAAEQPQQRPGTPVGAPGAPVTFGGQQPEMPANYYGAGGALVPPNPPGNPEASGNTSAPTQGQPQPQAEAQVQRPVPPPPNPFFANEDTDDQNGQEPLVARR